MKIKLYNNDIDNGSGTSEKDEFKFGISWISDQGTRIYKSNKSSGDGGEQLNEETAVVFIDQDKLKTLNQ